MNTRENIASRKPNKMAPPPVAIILIAGRGTRLAPLTDTMHKTLIEIGGEAILTRQMRQLGAQGITRFILVTGYREDSVREFATWHAPKNAKLDFISNAAFAETNTAYSLALALDAWQDVPTAGQREDGDGPFILLDGDVVMDDALPARLLSRQGENVLLCETDRTRLNNEAVKVRLAANGTVERIGKAVPFAEAAGESIGVGLYQVGWLQALRPRLALLRERRAEWSWYYEDVMNELLPSEAHPPPFRIEPVGNIAWAEIDNHADLKRARELFRSLK